MRVNVAALTGLTARILPGMIARRRGRILNVASTAAFQPGPFMSVYYASKAYVLSFSEALAEEMIGTGVTVTCLCPGPVKTNFQKRAYLKGTKLADSPLTIDVREVARIGYEGMKQGRRIVIPGWKNRILAEGVRLAPRNLLTKVVRRLQEKKDVAR